MYCYKCGAENLNDVSRFCHICGAKLITRDIEEYIQTYEVGNNASGVEYTTGKVPSSAVESSEAKSVNGFSNESKVVVNETSAEENSKLLQKAKIAFDFPVLSSITIDETEDNGSVFVVCKGNLQWLIPKRNVTDIGIMEPLVFTELLSQANWNDASNMDAGDTGSVDESWLVISCIQYQQNRVLVISVPSAKRHAAERFVDRLRSECDGSWANPVTIATAAPGVYIKSRNQTANSILYDAIVNNRFPDAMPSSVNSKSDLDQSGYKRCPNCGIKNSIDDNFCYECGTSLLR